MKLERILKKILDSAPDLEIKEERNMSYMRIGYPNKYVDGESKDYIYGDREEIIDYGILDDSSIVEIICRFLEDYLQSKAQSVVPLSDSDND